MPVIDTFHSGHRQAPGSPTTRFQGSKLKLLGWLWEHLRPLAFYSCLDAFGGSGCVSHFLKAQGKAVTFNDLLASSTINGIALVENECVQFSEADAEFIAHRRDGHQYAELISDTFGGIYFTDAENRWLDVVAQNIPRLKNRYKRAIAYYALFQSAMAKRPYNLFHRKNLYMRLATVKRSFGNKVTWDRPFDEHFRHFAAIANAAVFRASPCRAVNADACAVQGEFDLVYLDPPYVNGRGVGVDYHGFYHFLEGLTDYYNWGARIDHASKHRRLHRVPSRWTNPATIHQAFEAIFERHRRSILAVSYRSDGLPTLDELAAMIRRVKKNVAVHLLNRPYKYALSTNSRSSEALLIGTD